MTIIFTFIITKTLADQEPVTSLNKA